MAPIHSFRPTIACRRFRLISQPYFLIYRICKTHSAHPHFPLHHPMHGSSQQADTRLIVPISIPISIPYLGSHLFFHSVLYRLRTMLLHRRLHGPLVCTNHLGDFLAILEDQEGGHGAYTKFLGDIGHFVDIEFVEFDVGEFVGHFDDSGGDHFAGAAPVKEKECVSIYVLGLFLGGGKKEGEREREPGVLEEGG